MRRGEREAVTERDPARGDPPASREIAQARLVASAIPEPVVEVCRTLSRAGHAGVLVGGAVRDALLGKPVADWDVATSATPDEVIDLFARTIPTGIQHGTVTALVGGTRGGKGHDAEPVEITTFRGEGEYHDGRRPTHVEFLRSLEADLARRDLTVNALAWDPIAAELSDPFDGLGDLQRGVIRAVGDPNLRFSEDGLRTMRAVRFCATLAMDLEAQTAAAIPGALHVLDKVSRERVHVELTKLLKSPRPSRGLWPMAETGIWPRVLPEPDPVVRDVAIEAVDAMQADPVARLARLLRPVGDTPDGTAAIEAAIDALKTSRAEKTTIVVLTGPRTRALEQAETPQAIRQAVATLHRELLPAALDVLGADQARRTAVHAAVDGAPLTVGELAIKARDLIAAGVAKPGPALGDLMDGLLAWTMEDPTRNRSEALVEHARTLA